MLGCILLFDTDIKYILQRSDSHTGYTVIKFNAFVLYVLIKGRMVM